MEGIGVVEHHGEMPARVVIQTLDKLVYVYKRGWAGGVIASIPPSGLLTRGCVLLDSQIGDVNKLFPY